MNNYELLLKSFNSYLDWLYQTNYYLNKCLNITLTLMILSLST